MSRLYSLAFSGNLAEIRKLIESNNEIYNARHNGSTPLSAAAQNGHTEIVRYLLSDSNPQRDKVGYQADSDGTSQNGFF